MESSRLPQEIRDIHSYIDSIPFGEVDIKVTRVNRKTVTVHTVAQETLRYVDNLEAKKDLDSLVEKLIASSFSGDAHVKLQMKDGQINLIGIYSKKEKKYQNGNIQQKER